MNPKSFVRLSNIIGTISIILLLYWVFIFISSELFGLSIFKNQKAETFFMSILAILALMVGALIINIMFNLTRIAQKHNQDGTERDVKSKRLGFVLLAIFPLILAVLYGAEYLSNQRQKDELMESGKRMVNPTDGMHMNGLFNYDFDEAWMTSTSETLRLWEKIEKGCPTTHVLVKDTFGASNVFLGFGIIYETSCDNQEVPPIKEDYVVETSPEDREYLNSVFDKKLQEPQYSSSGNVLYYPVSKNGKTIVLKLVHD